jgi:hypothetical protein
LPNFLQDEWQSNGNSIFLLKISLFVGWDYDFGFKALLNEEIQEIEGYTSKVPMVVHATVDCPSFTSPPPPPWRYPVGGHAGV